MIVTGAGGGMGLAIAAQLADRGAYVVAVDLKPCPEELGDKKVGYLVADVSQESTAIEAARRAQQATGAIDHLVNAAGVAWFDRDKSIVETDRSVWDRVLEINLTGPMLFAKAVLPAMLERKRGSMVHIASVAGIRTSDGAMDAYQVSKAGLVSLSRGIAVNHGPDGVRSNTVCPGAVLTPMISSIYEEHPDRRTAMERRAPLNRLGFPEDISEAVCFLLSDAAAFITATDMVVDGGLIARTA